MDKIQTNFGSVTVDELVRIYNIYKTRDRKNQQRRLVYNQTEEGRDKNRERASSYYERNRDAVLEKRKEWYQKKKNSNDQPPSTSN